MLALVGCGTEGRRLPEDVVLQKEKDLDSNANQRILSAGGTVKIFTAGKDKSDNYYTVTWKEAEADFNLEEAAYGGKIQELSGTIVENGEVQSTFVAREGSVDKGTKRLNLAGGVKVTSKMYDASIESDVMAYDADTGILEAATGIKASMQGLVVKGVEVITAKGDLSEAWNNMKNGKKSGSLLAAVTSVALASGAGAIIQSELLGMKITGWSDFNYSVLAGGNLRVTVTGRPFGEWPKQGLSLRSSEVTLVASKNRDLISADMKGGITFTSKKSGEVMTVTAPSARYTDADQKLVVPGSITLDRKTANGDTVLAKGSGGTVFIDRNAKDADMVKSAELTGPIDFRMTSKRTDPETKKDTSYFVSAAGNNLTYSEANRKIILSGDVKVDGNDPSFIGTMSGVDRIEITLTENREIESVDLKGDPAKTVIEQKSKPPTGGGGKRKR